MSETPKEMSWIDWKKSKDLKLDDSRLCANFSPSDMRSVSNFSYDRGYQQSTQRIAELESEITALKAEIEDCREEKLHWFNKYQQSPSSDVHKSLQEKLALAVSIAQRADCLCSIQSRMSGHLTGCWKPELDETLAKIQGEKMEGKE